MFSSWSRSSFAPIPEVGVEVVVAAAVAVDEVLQVDAGTSGSRRTIARLARVGRVVKPGGGGGDGREVRSARCGGGVGHRKLAGR